MLSVESSLIDSFTKESSPADASPIFVLAAPRTGSTMLYQAIVRAFGLGYFANLVNDHFADTPVVGLAVQTAVGRVSISLESSFGKTAGLWQPSEASLVMRKWFGGGHPSQVCSAEFLDGMEDHFWRCLLSGERLFKAPLVVKNAWNCFRIAAIARALPRARFIWLKRDIIRAALSDLEARYRTKGSPWAWNSATPANVEQIRKLPPTAQVVRNQYEFNIAIQKALACLDRARWTALWYEEFCADPLGQLRSLAPFVGRELAEGDFSSQVVMSRRQYNLSPQELREVVDYTHSENMHMSQFCFDDV